MVKAKYIKLILYMFIWFASVKCQYFLIFFYLCKSYTKSQGYVLQNIEKLMFMCSYSAAFISLVCLKTVTFVPESQSFYLLTDKLS